MEKTSQTASQCSQPRVPMKSYEDLGIFKIYALDIGILRVLSEIDASVYLAPSPAFFCG